MVGAKRKPFTFEWSFTSKKEPRHCYTFGRFQSQGKNVFSISMNNIKKETVGSTTRKLIKTQCTAQPITKWIFPIRLFFLFHFPEKIRLFIVYFHHFIICAEIVQHNKRSPIWFESAKIDT